MDEKTSNTAIKVLVLEDDLEFAFVIKKILSSPVLAYNVIHVACLGDALQKINQDFFDILLIDLDVPDSRGLETFRSIHSAALETAIVVITAHEEEDLAITAVREGAQDYLNKMDVGRKTLKQAMGYAMERQQSQLSIQRMAFTDDLTGLYNRRGFISLCNKYLKLSQRTRKEAVLLFADLNGLKKLNDTFGHHEGDRALIDIAELLRSTFRESDVIARIGGDEFAVLAAGVSPEETDTLVRRLEARMELKKNQDGKVCSYSISVGSARYHPDRNCTVEELLSEADTAMYARKRGQKRPQEVQS